MPAEGFDIWTYPVKKQMAVVHFARRHEQRYEVERMESGSQNWFLAKNWVTVLERNRPHDRDPQASTENRDLRDVDTPIAILVRVQVTS